MVRKRRSGLYPTKTCAASVPSMMAHKQGAFVGFSFPSPSIVLHQRIGGIATTQALPLRLFFFCRCAKGLARARSLVCCVGGNATPFPARPPPLIPMLSLMLSLSARGMGRNSVELSIVFSRSRSPRWCPWEIDQYLSIFQRGRKTHSSSATEKTGSRKPNQNYKKKNALSSQGTSRIPPVRCVCS